MYNGNRNDFSRTSQSTPSTRDSAYLPANGMQMMPIPTGIPVQGMQTIPGIPVQPKSDPAHSSISTLQTMARRLNCVPPEYKVERVGGQDHAPVFRAVCSWNSGHLTSESTGSSKNEARRQAALQLIGILRARGVFVNGIPHKTSNPYDRDRKPIIKHSHSNRTSYFPDANQPKRQGPPVKPETFPIHHSELQPQPCNPNLGLESGGSSFAPPNGHLGIYPGPHQGSQRGAHQFNHHSVGRHPGSHHSGSHHPTNDHPSSQYPRNNQPGGYHSNSNHPNSSGPPETRHPRVSESEYRFDSSAGTSDNRLLEVPIPRAKQEPGPVHSAYPLPSQQLDLNHRMGDGPPRHNGPPHHRTMEDRPPPHQMDQRHRPHSGHLVHHSRLDAHPSKNKHSSQNGVDGGTVVASGHRSSSNSANSHSRNPLTNATDGAVSIKPVPTKPVIPKIPFSVPAPVEMEVTQPTPAAPKRDPRLALRRRSKQAIPAEGASAVSPPAATPAGGLEETDLSSGNAVENSYRPRTKEVKIDKPASAAELRTGSGKEVETSAAKDAVEKEQSLVNKSTPVLAEAKTPVESTAPVEDERAQEKNGKDNAAANGSSSKMKLQQATGSADPSPHKPREEAKVEVPMRKRAKARTRARTAEELGANAMQTEPVVKPKVGAGKQNGKGREDKMQVDEEGGNEMQAEDKFENGSPGDANEAVEDGEIKMDGDAPSPVAISMPPKIPLSAIGDRRKDAKSSSLRFGTSEALQFGDSRLVVPAKKRPRADLLVPTRVILWVFCDSREEQVINLLRAVTFGLYAEFELHIYVFGDAESNLRSSEKIRVFTVPVPGSEGKSTPALQIAMGFEAGRHSFILDKLRDDRATGHGTAADLQLSRIVILSSQPGFAAVANANTDVVKSRDLRKYVDDVHRRFCETNGGEACVSGNTGKA